MKLSEAILLGSTMHRQSFINYREDLATSATILMGHSIRGIAETRTCALGAALAAVGKLPDAYHLDDAEGEIELLFPLTDLNYTVRCPCCAQVDHDVFHAVVHFNDDHFWSRERIAQWVAGVEAEQEQPASDERRILADLLTEVQKEPQCCLK